jgi:hypothetical protein
VTAILGGESPILCPYRRPGDSRPQKIIIHSLEGGHCSVRLYRAEGRPCRRLWEGSLAPGEAKALFWDGADDGGQGVASGVYLAVFQDGQGDLHRSKIFVIR